MVKTNFFEYLDFALQFAPAGPEEKAIRAKLARIGIGPGKKFNFNDLRSNTKLEIGLGMKEGEKQGGRARCCRSGKNQRLAGRLGVRRPRTSINGDWLLRAAAAKAGIYGNDAVEAMYPMTRRTPPAQTLDGSKHNYTLTFPAGQFPPVNAFWSVTMYDGKTPTADRKPDRPLSHQFADAAGHEEERRRLADALHPEGFAGRGQGIQLAARARTARSTW